MEILELIYIEEFLKLIEVAKYVRVSYYLNIITMLVLIINSTYLIILYNKINDKKKYITQEQGYQYSPDPGENK